MHSKIKCFTLEFVVQQGKGLVSFLCTRVRSSLCMSVIPVVSYMPTEFAGCSVGSRISRGVHKLTRTPRVIKKNQLFYFIFSFADFQVFYTDHFGIEGIKSNLNIISNYTLIIFMNTKKIYCFSWDPIILEKSLSNPLSLSSDEFHPMCYSVYMELDILHYKF